MRPGKISDNSQTKLEIMKHIALSLIMILFACNQPPKKVVQKAIPSYNPEHAIALVKELRAKNIHVIYPADTCKECFIITQADYINIVDPMVRKRKEIAVFGSHREDQSTCKLCIIASESLK